MKQVFLDSTSLIRARECVSRLISEHVLPSAGSEIVPVVESMGRVTAGPVFAKYSSPFFHSAAMDGYAVRFDDTVTACETRPLLLKIGTNARYVNTGNPMPDGFNAIIILEDVNLSGDHIEIYQPVHPYQNVRVIGEDIVATEMVVPENHLIRPIDMGAMLACGHIEVKVRNRPKLAVIPTGSEIIDPEQVRNRPPSPPEIIEYNSVVIQGLARELGAEAARLPVVPDDLEKIRKAIFNAAASSDIVVINAGAGRGSEDYTLEAIQSLGEVLINGASIRPGKPVIIGIVNNKPVFGLPGYPVSAYITFRLFVKPVIEAMSGISSEEDEKIQAVLSRQISSPLGVDEFVRVKVGVVGNNNIATPFGRGAGLLMSLVRADGIIQVPVNSEGLSAGNEVVVELLRKKDVIRKTIVCIGSHDNSLDVLANFIKKSYPRYSLSSAHVGSMGGLVALRRGEAHFAGTHLLDENTGEYNTSYIKRYLSDKKIVLINLVYREQGLLVKKGNPKMIFSFGDLLRDDVFFINRQTGSGTRLLLDKYLKEQNITSSLIKGYDLEEYTHMALASAILSGVADTGLGIYSSAKALGLDFIPVARERYDLAVPYEFMGAEIMQPVLEIIRTDGEFRSMVQSMGGYDTSDMGNVVFESWI